MNTDSRAGLLIQTRRTKARFFELACARRQDGHAAMLHATKGQEIVLLIARTNCGHLAAYVILRLSLSPQCQDLSASAAGGDTTSVIKRVRTLGKIPCTSATACRSVRTVLYIEIRLRKQLTFCPSKYDHSHSFSRSLSTHGAHVIGYASRI